MPKPLFLAIGLIAGALAPSAGRAETVQTCTGFITSVPTVISTQGTWCMDKDLATAITSGAAIQVNTNNVRIDCNGFKLGNLAAGAASLATGIRADGRLNLTVRNCHVRGFYRGVSLSGAGAGHLVEHNLFDGVLGSGIAVQGDASVVRDNRVIDTGASSNSNSARGIETVGSVDVLDNLVAGVTPGTCCTAYGNAYGISTFANTSGQVARNRVSGIVNRSEGELIGISAIGAGRASLRDNHLVSGVPGVGYALDCNFDSISTSDNYVAGFQAAVVGCGDDGGNLVKP